jgi:hypothetical protein
MSTRFSVLLLVTALTACSDAIVSVQPPPPPPPPPTNVAVAYCAGLEPDWVAFQDGDGAWTHAQPILSGANTTFRAELSADRGAIAMVSGSGAFTIVSVLYGSAAELETAGDTNPRHCFPAIAQTLLGTAIGIDSGEVAFVAASFGSRVRVSVDSTFELKALPSGPRDLLATRFAQANGSGPITRMILRRGIDVPDGTQLPVFDFGSAEAFAPAVANATLDGLGAESATSGTRLLANHDEISVTLATNLTADVTRPYFALPEAQLGPGDLQVVTANTTAAATGSARSTTLYFRAPTDRTLTFGALLVQPTFTTVATAPALRLRAHFVPQNDYDRATVISYQQDSTLFVTVMMTAAYAAGSANGYDLVIPDLSGAAGFDPAWTLHQGGRLLWNGARIGGTLGLGRNAVPTDGATLRAVFATGAL